jgi:hypothetical protein
MVCRACIRRVMLPSAIENYQFSTHSQLPSNAVVCNFYTLKGAVPSFSFSLFSLLSVSSLSRPFSLVSSPEPLRLLILLCALCVSCAQRALSSDFGLLPRLKRVKRRPKTVARLGVLDTSYGACACAIMTMHVLDIQGGTILRVQTNTTAAAAAVACPEAAF